MSELYRHQQEGLDFLLRNNGGFLAYEMGLGKTRIVLEAFKVWKAQGYKLLVVCPLSLIRTAWLEDIRKFAPELTMTDLHGRYRSNTDIYVTNYEAFISKKRTAEIVDLITRHRFICCLDESSRISNFKSKTAKTMLSLRHQFAARLCLSGTPCSQSETQWWPQVTFLNDKILSSSFYGFRNTYFHLQRGKATMQQKGLSSSEYAQLFQKGWKFVMTDAKKKLLVDRLKPVVIWRKLDECLDMPEEVDQLRLVTMTPEQATAYKMMRQACITEINEKAIVATIALTKLMKLRQITSGFAITPAGEVQRFDKNPKLDELKEVLDELGDEQAIIFCNFKAEVEDIKGAFGENVGIIDGSTVDKAAELEAFKTGRYKYLCANIQSMAHGVTLVNCRYVVYYSHSYSAEDFAQSRARIRRIGQTRTCVYIHLQAEGTIDEKIYEVLKRKGEAVELLAELLK